MRDVDLDRACLAAGAAQRAGARQVLGGVQAGEQRCQHGADGAGIHPAVGVAADVLVDRADVEAGAAAQAIKRLAVVAAEDIRAPVVHDDHVQFLGAVEVVRPPRSGNHGDVAGYLLAGGAVGQHLQHHRQVVEPRDDLLHAHQRHVHARQGGRQPPVALVGHQDDGAGIGDGEVDARDAHVGAQELLAQGAAGDLRHVAQFFRVRVAEFVVQQRRDLLAGLVDGGRDDVRRRFLGELDDVFAEVGFQHLVPQFFQVRVEMNLLGGHRLALDDDLGLGLLGNAGDDVARLGGVVRPMHTGAEPVEVVGELLQIGVKPGNRPLLDGARLGTQRLRVAERLHGRHAPGHEFGGQEVQGLLQRLVLQGLPGVVLKTLSSQVHGAAPRRRGRRSAIRRGA